jgi:hypothetical protein
MESLAQMGRDVIADAIVQADEGVGGLHTGQGGFGMACLEPVDICAGQDHDEGALGVLLGEGPDGLGATPGVERDHQVGALAGIVRGDVDAMAQLA